MDEKVLYGEKNAMLSLSLSLLTAAAAAPPLYGAAGKKKLGRQISIQARY